MTTLFEAVNTQGLTTNGMATNLSSLNKCVDFFFLAGASRGKNIVTEFVGAYAENPEVATRLALWLRDARQGAGERQLFRDLVSYLIAKEPETATAIAKRVEELGRWDDLLTFFGTDLQPVALDLIKKALMAENGLCAKWMPRPNGKGAAKAKVIQKHLGLTPKMYRKLLVSLSDTVEQKMCAQEWDQIDFGQVPSVAAARYQKAFGKNAEVKYQAYIDALVKGDAKINAGAVYPYDVTKSVTHGNATVANQQWKALPNYLEGSNERILPVVDVSGSMGCSAGDNGNLSCMDVAISLGLYLSERIEGPFKDQFITFSMAPQMMKVTGSLSQRIEQMRRADWGMNTNLEAVFDLILTSAKACNVSEDQMPTKLIIFSDMEFDSAMRAPGQANRGFWRDTTPANPPAMEMIEQMYALAGFKMPQVVFWNLNARSGNVPVRADKSGAALVSGFSPSLMTSLLGDDTFTPEGIMLKTVMTERYDF